MATRVKKAKKEIVQEDSELQLAADGKMYAINTEEQAIKAVELAGSLSDRIHTIETGQLAEMRAEFELLRRSLNFYQDEHGLAEIKTRKYRSDLVERTGKMWLWDEIPEMFKDKDKVEEMVPLRRIISRKIRDKVRRARVMDMVTERVISPEGLDDAVKAGYLKAEDIAPAYVEFIATTYVQIKENK